MPLLVVLLAVIALCSCGAGQPDHAVAERVEAIIQETCRAESPGPSEQRDCIEMLRRETDAGFAAAQAWLDETGGGTSTAGPDEASWDDDSPGEWLLTRPVPTEISFIAMGLLGAYVVFSFFTILRRRK